MRCRFNWGIYFQHANGVRELMRSYWSGPRRCDSTPGSEIGICLEEITEAA